MEVRRALRILTSQDEGIKSSCREGNIAARHNEKVPRKIPGLT